MTVVVDLCASNLAHGVVEREAEDQDMEVDGIAGHVSFGPAPVRVFDDETGIGGQNKVAGLLQLLPPVLDFNLSTGLYRGKGWLVCPEIHLRHLQNPDHLLATIRTPTLQLQVAIRLKFATIINHLDRLAAFHAINSSENLALQPRRNCAPQNRCLACVLTTRS